MDGHEYVDLTMGFGVHMFGHSPDFVSDAIAAQLRQGVQLGPQGIRVNSISPGAIATPINLSARDTPEEEKALLTLIPYNRVGDPDDVGNLAAWLASDEADYITGQTIFIDGGMTLYPGFASGG